MYTCRPLRRGSRWAEDWIEDGPRVEHIRDSSECIQTRCRGETRTARRDYVRESLPTGGQRLTLKWVLTTTASAERRVTMDRGEAERWCWL